jgi:hypothetical protein|tara:strand:+ start:51 stop:779 length:729 start_codon:yes stop_codon:yes gene_type:complete
MTVPTPIEKARIFAEIKAKMTSLKKANDANDANEPTSVFFGVNCNSVYKDTGNVIDGGSLLKILGEEEWRQTLATYSISGISVRVVERFKAEITAVHFFPDLGDTPYEVRFYALDWKQDSHGVSVAKMPSMPYEPRLFSVPSTLLDETAFFIPHCFYVFCEIKPLLSADWESCAVCGIQRKESIPCSWNDSFHFCSLACQFLAQEQENQKTAETARNEDGICDAVHKLNVNMSKPMAKKVAA